MFYIINEFTRINVQQFELEYFNEILKYSFVFSKLISMFILQRNLALKNAWCVCVSLSKNITIRRELAIEWFQTTFLVCLFLWKAFIRIEKYKFQNHTTSARIWHCEIMCTSITRKTIILFVEQIQLILLSCYV